MNPWEFHPMLVHFPIAFLLAGVVLDLIAVIRPSETRTRSAAGLLLAGTMTGWLAAIAGLAAFWTVPAHTDAAHGEMYWHLGLAIAMLLSFTWLSVKRWRRRLLPAKRPEWVVALCAAALLVVTGDLGGGLVFRGGAGVDPQLLAPEIRSGHTHQAGGSEESHDQKEPTHGGNSGHGH